MVMLRDYLPDSADMIRSYADVIRPREHLSPSEWAERYRYLKEGTTERPGRWSNEYFPYLAPIMDAHQEAMRSGKRGVVLIKSGQGGGSEAEINVLAWLLDQHPGPALYLISKDEIAREFGRERFAYINATAEPLKRKALTGRGSGELIHIKRYIDAKLVIQGGRSVLNLQSQPYRYVMIDEFDSLLDEIEGHGDPLKLAEIRTSAFSGQTGIFAFAHPSTRDRGAGRLYYDQSDQRRGFVTCPHCAGEFWLQWDHVRVIPDDGLTKDQCARDPRYYHYFAPCCGAEISDAQRWVMCRSVKQKSILAPEEAARRPWVGLHFSQLYMLNWPLARLAEEYIAGLDDEAVMRVFQNKRMGDVFDPAVKETSVDAWRKLIVIKRSDEDDRFYQRGQVPRGVRFLTAGQDSGSRKLHWAVWGWGLLRDSNRYPVLCGWLIDWGTVEREYSLTLDASELAVFDGKIYDRGFLSTDEKRSYWVRHGLHDSGWQEIPVYEYCRRRPDRSIPCKGDAADSASKAPAARWGSSPQYKIEDVMVKDPALRLLVLNTYTLKLNWIGLVEKSILIGGDKHCRLTLPVDVDDEFLAQSASEYLATHKKKMIWKHRGPNHYSDCNVYAYAAALNLNPFQDGLPFDEAQEMQKKKAEARAEAQRRPAQPQRAALPRSMQREMF